MHTGKLDTPGCCNAYSVSAAEFIPLQCIKVSIYGLKWLCELHLALPSCGISMHRTKSNAWLVESAMNKIYAANAAGIVDTCRTSAGLAGRTGPALPGEIRTVQCRHV
jgi:hypothetical protein